MMKQFTEYLNIPSTDINLETAIKAINDPEYHFSMIQEVIGILRINLNDTLARDVDITNYNGYDACTEYYQLKDGILGLRGVYRVHTDDIWDPIWDEVYKQNVIAFEGKDFPEIVMHRNKIQFISRRETDFVYKLR